MERCRTAALGGHIEQCDSCGFERPAYNSCRNRHCPKCQSLAKIKWLDKQKSELLPVGYFHLVFTLPHELNGLILTNKKILLSHLFKAVGETLVDFGHTRLGGQIGFITVLHTWDQTLLDHFHLHCLVPAGALSFDQKRWTPARKNFLFPVKALSIVFRGKFLDLLKKAFAQNKLLFVGQTASLADACSLQGLLIQALRKKSWVVYAKKPFGSPVHVLDYLGRYTHRVALSNDRIVSAYNGEVTFSYRDRKNQKPKKDHDPRCPRIHPPLLAPCDPQRLRARASLRFLGQPIQKPSLKVPSTPGPHSCSAQAPLKIRLRADASTHRHRYHSMPSMPQRELWSSLPTCPSPHHGILRDDRSTNKKPCSYTALCQSPRIGSTCFIISPLLGRLSIAFRYPVATNRCVNDAPACLLTINGAAMSALANLLGTIPIDIRHCFTHRFSPTGFILNASDCNCCHPIVFSSHSG